MPKIQPLELLAPAKNADIGIEAINHGADAVYIGGPSFGARVEAANAFDDLDRLTSCAHRYGARVFMTLNTIVADHEMDNAVKAAWRAYESGVDALIVQDMGLLEADLPPIQLHASTQCDVRTPEKARFLESLGFSQIVLARELSLEAVRACYGALKDARIEHFIHGALCVSYSGQCYASFAANGRSANRGACAQLCRLPYSVFTEAGEVLVREKHVLSLKDNNQTDHLTALIEAGVRSFKIEGRLKDMGYVKNITAHYRQRLDAFLNDHPEFAQASDGHCTYTFEPAPEKSFNRGFTDYFTIDRRHDLAVFDTPKNTGPRLGTVMRVNADTVDVKTTETMSNSDGLTYLTREGELEGFAVNRADNIGKNLWRLTLRDRPIWRRHPQLAPGMTLYRNRDKLWDDLLERNSAVRKVPVKAHWQANETTFALTLTDNRGTTVTVTQTPEKIDIAGNVERNQQNLATQIKKMGNTLFEVSELTVTGGHYFAPTSFINQMRREAVEALDAKRVADLPRLLPREKETGVPYSDACDFRANVLNEQAVRFYKNHGVTITEGAFETGEIDREVPVMLTKHCVRFALGRCLKDNIDKIKADPTTKDIYRPDPLILKTANRTYRATFDCKACEMTLWGKRLTAESLGKVKV